MRYLFALAAVDILVCTTLDRLLRSDRLRRHLARFAPTSLRQRRLTSKHSVQIPITPTLVITPDISFDSSSVTSSSSSSNSTSTESHSLLRPSYQHPPPRRVDSAIHIHTLRTNDNSRPLPPPEPRVKHTLFVCTKCERRSDPIAKPACRAFSAAASICTSLCVPQGEALEMEDMLTPGSPRSPTLGPTNNPRKRGKVSTGKRLYRDLVTRHHDPHSPTASLHASLEILPVDCLSRCDSSNTIAYAAPGKYTYQFGGLKEGDPKTVEEILQFTKDWIQSDRLGYTKGKDRPKELRATVLARIPPVKEVKLDESELHGDMEVIVEDAEDRDLKQQRLERVRSWHLGD